MLDRASEDFSLNQRNVCPSIPFEPPDVLARCGLGTIDFSRYIETFIAYVNNVIDN